MEDYNNWSDMNTNGPVQRLDPAKIGKNSMAKAAQVCGVIGIISIFTMMIYPAIVLGSMAIILALLSRGSESKLPDKARKGLTTGIIALVVDLSVVIVGVALIFSDGPYKQEINSISKQMYGQTFDDMLQDAMDGSLDLEYRNLPIDLN